MPAIDKSSCVLTFQADRDLLAVGRVPLPQSIILNTKSIILNAKFMIFNAQFMISIQIRIPCKS